MQAPRSSSRLDLRSDHGVHIVDPRPSKEGACRLGSNTHTTAAVYTYSVFGRCTGDAATSANPDGGGGLTGCADLSTLTATLESFILAAAVGPESLTSWTVL